MHVHIYIYTHTHTHEVGDLFEGRGPFRYSLPLAPVPLWPLQDRVLLLVVCARINRPFIRPARLHCPHCCNTIARLLASIRPPTRPPLVYAIHHTTLAMAISCKGQAATLPVFSNPPPGIHHWFRWVVVRTYRV